MIKNDFILLTNSENLPVLVKISNILMFAAKKKYDGEKSGTTIYLTTQPYDVKESFEEIKSVIWKDNNSK